MSDRVIVRRARPEELTEVGRLTVETYVADGYAKPAGSYAAELADASRRARDAELLVAVSDTDPIGGSVA